MDAFQPHAYFQRTPRPPDRWRALGMQLHAYKLNGGGILLDGASNKYCHWNDLGGWSDWGQGVIERIREHTRLPIVYRPRPSHNEAPVVRGRDVRTSNAGLLDDFRQCRVVASHGGNIGFDCAVYGKPHFAIGASVARALSETDWRRVEVPFYPHDDERVQWLHDVAYCQWTIDEFADGSAWRYIRGVIDELR